MSRRKAALSSIVLALVLAAPASAQIAGHPWEFSGGAGGFNYDGRARMKDSPAYLGSFGWRYEPWLTFEGSALFGSTNTDTVPPSVQNFTLYAADARFNLRPGENRAVPFVLVGIGMGQSHNEGVQPAMLQRGAGHLGLGLLLNLFDQRTYVRLQVQDVWFRERDALEFSNHYAATAGLQFAWGGRPRDSDLDGVRDGLDKCPNTPIGAKVDANGCPIDNDGDGVFDGLDKCPGTARGCKIDKDGCPIDTDGDGICDGLDQCPDTPKGAVVNLSGCPIDSDADSVYDGLDKCPNTQKGCLVDQNGCPIDSDGDGVCNGLDQCPNTPAGLKVDVNGCPIEVSEKEVELLDTGMIRLQNIEFDTGKANLKPESYPVLDDVGKILQQYPMLKIEIGGHTDNRGSKALNEKLSQARADSVFAYVRGHFSSINVGQYTTHGYGFDAPIAPNTTDLGRAKNRRVEFKVLNADTLRIEREKRRFLRKDEGAPAPSPAPQSPAPAPPKPTPQPAPAPPQPAPAPPDTTKHVPAPPDTTKKP